MKCKDCNEEYSFSKEELNMYNKVGIEPSTLCFLCRVKLYLSFWMFGKFRKGKSDLSGKNLITVLPESVRFPIYTSSEWFSDEWDPMDYGMKYDENRNFFDQLKELQEKVPRPHQNGNKNYNCEWCDDVWSCKNSYLSRSMIDSEDLFYSYRNINVKNSIDVTVCFNSEKCYDSLNCCNSYKLFYSRHSRDCIDSFFLFDCRNCQNCFMSWNLRGKFYCIENVQYTKEEYFKKLEEFKLDSYSSIKNFKKRFNKIISEKVVHRENFNIQVANSEGEFLMNVKNCHNSHTIQDSEDCFNYVRGKNVKSSIDMVGCWDGELLGNCSSCVDAYALKYSVWSSSRNSEYLDLCIECDKCFGSVGLKKKKYCIFNKQYTKEKYEELKDKIIRDMGKQYGNYLPYSMTPGPFNFSSASLYFPETKKEDVLKLGGYWEDVGENKIEGMATSDLPDSINEVSDNICTQALICPETGWRFNIAEDELSFYKENNIPLPRYHFDIRNKDRFKYLAVLKLYPYKCYYCKKDIEAYYLPEWGYRKIACLDCYQQNIN